MNEDQYMAAEQDRLYMQRQERDRTDAIIDARHDLIAEAKVLRAIELAQYTSETDKERDYALQRLASFTDRLNKLEGDTA